MGRQEMAGGLGRNQSWQRPWVLMRMGDAQRGGRQLSSGYGATGCWIESREEDSEREAEAQGRKIGPPFGRSGALVDSHRGKRWVGTRLVPLERASAWVELRSQTSSYVPSSDFGEQANPVGGRPPGGIPWGTRAVE